MGGGTQHGQRREQCISNQDCCLAHDHHSVSEFSGWQVREKFPMGALQISRNPENLPCRRPISRAAVLRKQRRVQLAAFFAAAASSLERCTTNARMACTSSGFSTLEKFAMPRDWRAPPITTDAKASSV